MTVVSNTIYDVGDSGIYFHCGTNNTAVNNVVYGMSVQHAAGVVKSCNHGGNPTWPALPHGFTMRTNVLVAGPSPAADLFTDSDYRATAFDGNVYWGVNRTKAQQLHWPNGSTWAEWRAGGNDTHRCGTAPLPASPPPARVTTRVRHHVTTL